MPNQGERLGMKEAWDEAQKMQDKIISGEASDYTEAENQLDQQNEKKESFSSPEEIYQDFFRHFDVWHQRIREINEIEITEDEKTKTIEHLKTIAQEAKQKIGDYAKQHIDSISSPEELDQFNSDVRELLLKAYNDFFEYLESTKFGKALNLVVENSAEMADFIDSVDQYVAKNNEVVQGNHEIFDFHRALHHNLTNRFIRGRANKSIASASSPFAEHQQTYYLPKYRAYMSKEDGSVQTGYVGDVVDAAIRDFKRETNDFIDSCQNIFRLARKDLANYQYIHDNQQEVLDLMQNYETLPLPN